jgi:uracil-DNA glycosylase family 4
MIIGEAPGETEDKLGRPFVGKAGKRLNEALIAAGLKRDEVYITNIYKFRPPNNRKPTLEEIVEHWPYLSIELDEVKPRFVLLLGNTALETFGKTTASANGAD